MKNILQRNHEIENGITTKTFLLNREDSEKNSLRLYIRLSAVFFFSLISVAAGFSAAGKNIFVRIWPINKLNGPGRHASLNRSKYNLKKNV